MSRPRKMHLGCKASALAIAVLMATPAAGQSSASDFTSGTRYDLARRVVGMIAPDPDGSGSLKFAAIRNTYDAAGNLTLIEKGQLSDWQSEGVQPSAWPTWNGTSGFQIFSKVVISYDAMDRKTVEAVWGWDTATSTWVQASATQYSYDIMGRLDCTAQRLNPATWSALPSSACTLATAGSFGPDRITRTVYDAAGQVLRVQKAYGTSLQQDYVTYTYSDNGKVTTVKDADGNKAGYTYDGFDRQTQWNFPDKVTTGTISGTDYEAYTYDANGNRTSLRKRDGSVIGYSYDALNRMTVKDIPGGTLTDVYYAYDLRGLQTSALFGSTSGAGLTNSYDGFGRLTTASNNLSGTALTLGYQYDANGNRTRLTYPDGNYVNATYDGLDRQIELFQNSGWRIVYDTYDAQGRRNYQARWNVGTYYTYDAVSRLASVADDLVGTASDVTTALAYSPASQIASKTRYNDAYAFTGPSGAGYVNVSRSYTANGLNQYTTAGGTSFTYDANGNLTGDGSYTYGYDVENRLTSKSSGLAIAYDPNGRLWQTSGGVSGTTRYLYDGDQLVAEYDGSGNVLRRFVHGLREDDPLIWYEGAGLSASRSLQVDNQGSIVSIADSSGAMLAIDSYDEYGIPGSGNIGRFQYTGQAWLPDLGMYYYKARIYSPTLGRFMQTDPIGYKDQNNLYSYVGNDPIDGTDPSGMLSEMVTGTLFDNVAVPFLSVNGVDLQSAVNLMGDPADKDKSTTGKITKATSTTAGGLGVGASIVENGSGKATIRIPTTQRPTPRVSVRGFRGNQYVRTTSLGKLARNAGRVLIIFSTASDLVDLKDGRISLAKFGENRLVDGIGALGGWPGAAAATTYYLFETFYDGGFNQAVKDRVQTDGRMIRETGGAYPGGF